MICTGPARGADQPGVGVGDDLSHQVGAGGGLGELVDLRLHVGDGHAERRRRGVGGDGGDLGRGWPASSSTTAARSALWSVSKATRCSHHPPAARARQTAATKNSTPARPRRIGRVSRIAGRRLRTVSAAARCRRCCGGACAGAAPGAAGAARSSPAGSRKQETCRTCGIGWHRGYEGFELGAMAISAVVCLGAARRRADDRRRGDVAGHRRAPLLLILGVGAIVLPIVVVPVSYTIWQAVDLAMRPPAPGDGTRLRRDPPSARAVRVWTNLCSLVTLVSFARPVFVDHTAVIRSQLAVTPLP